MSLYKKGGQMLSRFFFHHPHSLLLPLPYPFYSFPLFFNTAVQLLSEVQHHVQ